MIKRHAPAAALDTYPNYQHQFMGLTSNIHYNQMIMHNMSLPHNHPSGDPTPSTADVRLTRDIVEIAKPFNIAVHDHLVIGRHGHASLKGLKMI